jgi:hypothetical protein
MRFGSRMQQGIGMSDEGYNRLLGEYLAALDGFKDIKRHYPRFLGIVRHTLIEEDHKNSLVEYAQRLLAWDGGLEGRLSEEDRPVATKLFSERERLYGRIVDYLSGFRNSGVGKNYSLPKEI